MACGNYAAAWGIVDGMTGPTEEMRAMSSPRHGSDGAAVDAWLRRDLAERYDGVLREALPQEMLALLAELA